MFRVPHQRGQGSGPEEKVNDKLSLCEVTGRVKEGNFSFDETLPVVALEAVLQYKFGLPVQVFRRSGELWLETTQTDGFSLDKQNEMGREASQVGKISFNANTLFL